MCTHLDREHVKCSVEGRETGSRRGANSPGRQEKGQQPVEVREGQQPKRPAQRRAGGKGGLEELGGGRTSRDGARLVRDAAQARGGWAATPTRRYVRTQTRRTVQCAVPTNTGIEQGGAQRACADHEVPSRKVGRPTEGCPTVGGAPTPSRAANRRSLNTFAVLAFCDG